MLKKLLLLIEFMILIFSGCSSSNLGEVNTLETSSSPIKPLILEHSEFCSIDNFDIHYCDEGNKYAHTLLLIHGGGVSLHTYNEWVEILKKDFRVVRLDVPGFGLTSHPDPPVNYSRELWLNCINQFVNQLNLKRFSVIGNSLGGYLAWNYTIAFPEKVHSLILIDPVGYPQKFPLLLNLATYPLVGDFAKVMMPRFMVKMCLKEVYGNPDLLTDEFIDRSHEIINLPGAKSDFIAILRKMKAKASDPLLGRCIKNIKCPVLIQWGELDSWLPVQLTDKWASDLPGATIIKYPDLGHIPYVEEPYKTAQDARKFLMKIL
jgi:pimeloyl-ACP methyl ester carboxylesterase